MPTSATTAGASGSSGSGPTTSRGCGRRRRAGSPTSTADRESPVAKVELVRLFHDNILVGEQPPYQEFTYCTYVPAQGDGCRERRRRGGRSRAAPGAWEPSSSAAEHRADDAGAVGWGAVAAVWALTSSPTSIRSSPRASCLRALGGTGPWNLLPHLGGSTPAIVPAAARGLAHHHGRVQDPAQLVRRRALPDRAPAGQRRIFNSGDLLLRLVGIAVVLSPCGLLWSVDAVLTGVGAAPDLLRAPLGDAAAAARAGGGLPAVGVGEGARDTWHDGTAIACPCASRTSSDSWRPTGCSTRPCS